MALLVGDANVFIDFAAGDLLDAMFEMSDEIAVPDLLFEEELREQHENLLSRGLRTLPLSPEAMIRAQELTAKYRRPSRLDLTALALAEQRECPLLTGDRHLRDAAQRERVVVHGTLWLAERLASDGVITIDRMALAYERMRSAGRRLPWVEADLQLRRLRA